MPLFFNNKFNNINNKFNQSNIQSDITLKPLTKEELEKINQEIQENIEKNKNSVTNINFENNTLEILKYVEDFIQDEANSHIFYKALACKCENKKTKEKIENISKECLEQCISLKDYYKSLKNETFEEKPLNINGNISLKNGLFFAIEEEMKSYDKICKAIDILPINNTKTFYQIALKKLSRINVIQYIAINEIF